MICPREIQPKHHIRGMRHQFGEQMFVTRITGSSIHVVYLLHGQPNEY